MKYCIQITVVFLYNNILVLTVSNRIEIFIRLIILTALTCQLVNSTVITISTTGVSDNTTCCVDGECVCTSLSTALLNLNSNTIINITSSSVVLNSYTQIGSGRLKNITISGNNATVMCNGSGAVYCEYCNDVFINGIIWDKCGHSMVYSVKAGVECDNCHNITLANCTFQYSPVAVDFSEVTGIMIIESCKFLYNTNYGLRIINKVSGSHGCSLVISGSTFHSNKCAGCLGSAFHLDINSKYGTLNTSVLIEDSLFTSNIRAIEFSLVTGSSHSVEFARIIVSYNSGGLDQSYTSGISLTSQSHSGTASVVVSSALFENNTGIALSLNATASMATVLLLNSSFVNNTPIINYYEGSGILLIKPGDKGKYVKVNLTDVSFSHNKYEGENGGTVYIYTTNKEYEFLFSNCTFQNNTSHGHGTGLYIDNSHAISSSYNSSLIIFNSTFYNNSAEKSVIYIKEGNVAIQNLTLSSVQFVKNFGSSLYLPKCNLHLFGSIYFLSNVAENGAAFYCYHGTTINITEGVDVTFINNMATEYGGAVFIDVDPVMCQSGFYHLHGNVDVLFQDNLATFAGDSFYFSIPDLCSAITNINYYKSICQFNYTYSSQRLPCIGNVTQDVGTYPVMTSPHMLTLYFPYDNGGKISDQSYYILHNALGVPLMVSGIVHDYFGTPCEVTIFDLQCTDCPESIELVYSNVIVDTNSSLNMIFVGSKIINPAGINVTVTITGLLMTTILVVELLPCEHHPGNVYDVTTKGCVCFHNDIINCYEDYNEIKRGYWFGSVSGRPTTSLCPSHYCNFPPNLKTTDGFFELPNTVDGQCNNLRRGIACGECSPRYTLAYDSTDCISVDHCSVGMTVLVVALTCLYWIVVVVGVFSLMYLNVQVSLGYLYGIIYFYSMVVILLYDNPDMSDSAFRFVSVLSSFAQLSPQFLGELCFIKGLSGIDQLFIHYFHAAAVSLLVLGLVVAARCSVRITRFVSRCIIRVICLLLLLSYTSIASTSLQLLHPLKFAGTGQLYTYLSPHIKYFHGRHAFYGSVAVVCELVIVIGLPLILLLEPFVNRKINFIKIKPLLDQFQSPYKNKYRWFAAYYLICRQAIVLTVYTSNDSYNTSLLYVNIVIVTIHLWIQPYKNIFLNAMDSLFLLFMVLLVVAPLLPSAATAATLVFIVFPLAFVCFNGIVKMVSWCLHKRKPHHQYVAINKHEINDDDDDENIVNRRYGVAIASS